MGLPPITQRDKNLIPQKDGEAQESQTPNWYRQLNTKEKKIINLFLKNGISCVLSGQWLETELCRQNVMDRSTLTDRLNCLVEKDILFEIWGDKKAVGYGPRFLLDKPSWRLMICEEIDAWSPEKACIFRLIPIERISDDEMIQLFEHFEDSFRPFFRGTDKEWREYLRSMRIWVREK